MIEPAEPPTHWPHAPPHRLEPTGTYMMTAGTYLKEHYFCDGKRLHYLHDTLLKVAIDQGWQLEAWAVFANHYHFVARRLPSHFGSTATLKDMVARVHQDTSAWVNEQDGAPGRKVWHTFGIRPSLSKNPGSPGSTMCTAIP